ncbi:response regulator transcription factor [Acidipropionibacterium virtanenii]|uniref:Transcriptional regulatory protein DegU n=1 Tax=Acidipropionibacterium virtanenii TaxID=2057246 RepID=A0A344UVS9_9ACTN|nr:response regulator transcription factor [Acidipropionibacterium virtanenii]AXE39377.1 Transcriptional regulatory protein DegU [Acidipropionibacterium virtanenii]
MGRLRILVVDDDQVLRDGLSALIGFDSSLGDKTMSTARDGQEALVRCIASPPDLVVMDIRMPRLNGIEATRRIVREHPGVKVLALTTLTTQEYVAPMLAAGASGYLVKDRTDELIPAIHAVLADEFYISPRVSDVLVRMALDAQDAEKARDEAVAPAPREENTYPKLGPQELAAVRWLAHGYSNAEIADAMGISVGSVKSYLAKAGEKLATRDRVQLLIRATELGLVHPAIDGSAR